ncbi:hypothetical protein [Mycobacterium sp. PSTR-4-N]|uniref:hypothetical protein n=1 Tax=Mycobacterium sp. PSTR-4-N TaxID=2917745 RepID=UPI001F1543D3|nr:hypothetical protein [Mycobacterium sp. PSTR-4-N]MCG7592381.1 hypothetical protein [Mycobacterium sp. PSTR-4-N]
MQSLNSAVVLSRGSTWNPRRSEHPYLLPHTSGLREWPEAAAATIIFTGTNGDVLLTLDGDVYPDRIEFYGDPDVMDPIPAGANFEIYLDTNDGTFQIRHGKVIRREAMYSNALPVSVTPALSFTDSFQRDVLGRKWKTVWGQTVINDNSDLSLPNGVSVKNAFFKESAIRFWQEFSSDSVEVGFTVVNRLNSQAGKTGVAICCDIGLNTGFVCELETGTGHQYLHLGVLNGPISNIYQGAAVPNTAANGDYYRLRYTYGDRTLSAYKNASLEPLTQWVDETEMVPNGKGYRHLGMNFEASLATRGIQVTSMAARDAA